MSLSYLLLGGNIDDRLFYINKAKEFINIEIGNIIKESGIYETEPWGFKSEQYFLNQVIFIETKLSPQKLLETINIIEQKLERKRTQNQYSSRTIDIDILFYDNLVINEKNLIIPHPKLQNRKFTLIPLNEINPVFNHPVLNKSIADLLKECTDKSVVKEFLF